MAVVPGPISALWTESWEATAGWHAKEWPMVAYPTGERSENLSESNQLGRGGRPRFLNEPKALVGQVTPYAPFCSTYVVSAVVYVVLCRDCSPSFLTTPARTAGRFNFVCHFDGPLRMSDAGEAGNRTTPSAPIGRR